MSAKRRREVDLEDLNRSVHNNDNDSSNLSFHTSSLEGTAVQSGSSSVVIIVVDTVCDVFTGFMLKIFSSSCIYSATFQMRKMIVVQITDRRSTFLKSNIICDDYIYLSKF